MLTGNPPFYDKNVNIMFTNIVNKKIEFPLNVFLTKESKNLIESLLDKNVFLKKLIKYNKNLYFFSQKKELKLMQLKNILFLNQLTGRM